MNDRKVSREASQIARDARTTKGLSDAESEVLEDLLKQDEAFGLLVTAQQSAVLVDGDDHDVDEMTEHLAGMAASSAGRAIDRIINDRIDEAEAIMELADRAGDESIPWGEMIRVYRAGFESIEDLQAATVHEITAEAGCAPRTSERIKAAVGGEGDR